MVIIDESEGELFHALNKTNYILTNKRALLYDDYRKFKRGFVLKLLDTCFNLAARICFCDCISEVSSVEQILLELNKHEQRKFHPHNYTYQDCCHRCHAVQILLDIFNLEIVRVDVLLDYADSIIMYTDKCHKIYNSKCSRCYLTHILESAYPIDERELADPVGLNLDNYNTRKSYKKGNIFTDLSSDCFIYYLKPMKKE